MPGGKPLVIGVDISPTAIKQARKKFPHIQFLVSDIRRKNFLKGKRFDLVVCKELMWYVFNKLSLVRENLKKVTGKNGYLYISQSFPEEYVKGGRFVGCDVISGPERLRDIFNRHPFSLKHLCIEWDYNYGGRPLVHILLKKGGSR